MRRLALTGALLMLCTNTAAGCRQQEKQEVTPEVLMDAVDKNMKEVNSASSSLEIEVELEDVLDHTRIRMDMDMENTVSPRAGHAKGRAEVKLNDNLVSSNMEIYQVEEGDKYVTYSSLYEQWSRTESETAPLPVVQKQIFSRVQERKSKIYACKAAGKGPGKDVL